MDQARYSALRFERAGRVLTITMDPGHKANIVTRRLHDEMAQVFHEAAEDPESDVIILTGAGSVFCGGGDMNWLRDDLTNGFAPFAVESLVMKRIVQGLVDCPKPVIARVNGDAMGFGASVALLCDVVIAVETARFADPHVRVGLSAGDGGAVIWPQLIGFAKAKHYLLTGEPLHAIEAERLGLITFAIKPEEFDDYVAKYAQKLARGAQSAIRFTKVTANLALRSLLVSVFEAGAAYEGLCKYTADYREGVTALLEKRRPNFTGV